MPAELEVDGSDLRLQRADLTFTGSPPKAHEAYAIAVVEPPLQDNQIGPALEDTRNYVEDVLQVRVIVVHSILLVLVFISLVPLFRDTLQFLEIRMNLIPIIMLDSSNIMKL